jgi:cytochrome P450
MSSACPHDPFKDARTAKGVLPLRSNDEPILAILRYRDVRNAAKDWRTFSSDAPFRVPIPSEESVRSVRQLPIEADPPEHGDYRKLVEPTFRRPTQPEFIRKVEALVNSLLEEAAAKSSVEIVREFALPLQSRALTYLLNMPESEADVWIGWGVHVFHDGPGGAEKGANLDAYIRRKLQESTTGAGDDFFSELTRASYRGRPLTEDEMVGFANLTFAGGRDTIIHTVSHIIGYMAEHPEALAALRDDPKLVMSATEEFVRVVTPLTHIGRKCPVATVVEGETVEADQRIALCWASANFDETVFDAPEEVRLDRRPNPHIGFGSGVHSCIGAAHARLIIRSLLKNLAERVEAITILEQQPHIEVKKEYQRQVAYDALTVRIHRRAASA